MKEKRFFITLVVVISISCLSNKNNLDRKNDSIIAYLDSINPSINLDEDSIGFLSIYYNIDIDTSNLYGYPMYMKKIDDNYWGIIGNFIDSLNMHALITNPKDSTISFYHKQNETWEKIGSDRVDTEYILGVNFMDLNGDGKKEIVCYSPPNMNANMWFTVYTKYSDTDSIKYAGSFETEFEIKKDQKRIETNYGGSWWMPLVKTIYMWRNEKLVPIKRLQISLKDADMIHDDRIIEYFENPTYDQDSLETVYSRDYLDKDSTVYDNFFRDN